MIRVKLREAMESYSKQTGERLTYNILAQRTGLSRRTLESIGSRGSYSPTLATLDKIVQALGCSELDEILELDEASQPSPSGG